MVFREEDFVTRKVEWPKEKLAQVSLSFSARTLFIYNLTPAFRF